MKGEGGRERKWMREGRDGMVEGIYGRERVMGGIGRTRRERGDGW